MIWLSLENLLIAIKLKVGFRKIASRYERLNVTFKGLVDIVFFMLFWKKNVRRVLK